MYIADFFKRLIRDEQVGQNKVILFGGEAKQSKINSNMSYELVAQIYLHSNQQDS